MWGAGLGQRTDRDMDLGVRVRKRALWRAFWRGGLAIAGLALLSTLIACRFSPSISVLEFALLDKLMGWRPCRQPHPSIALVGFDKAAIDEHKAEKPAGCACRAIARNDIGKALSRIKKAGARVVVLDLMLEDECPVGRGTPHVHDQPLVAALKERGETILAATTDANPDQLFFHYPPAAFVGDTSRGRIMASPVLCKVYGVVRGVSLRQIGAPSDQEKNSAGPVEWVGRTLPALSIAAYCAYAGSPCEIPEPVRYDRLGCAGMDIPVWCDACICLFEPIMSRETPSKHVMLINWAGPTGTFPPFSFARVLRADDTELSEWFEGKLVLIGSVSDRFHTPMRAPPRVAGPPYVDQSNEVAMSGLEIHANALDTIMQGRFVRPMALPVVWAVIFGCSVLTILAFLRFSTWPAVAAALVQIAVLFVLAVLLVRWDRWVYTVIPTIAIVFSGTVTGLWGYAWSRREAAALAREMEAREATTATLAHDLKQPLAAISALAAAIRATQQSGAEETDWPELVGRIQRQVQRAVADIDDLVTASPDREIHLTAQRFDIAALSRDLAVAQSVKSSVHEVEVHAPAEGILLTGDPRYLGRALSNLMDNAIKYWPDGGTIVVQLERRRREVVVRVIDNGVGISPEQQSRIFERFQRAVPDRLRVPGTGIGLYSVKRIAEAHGGSIEVESKPDVGSTFVLTIPDQPASAKK